MKILQNIKFYIIRVKLVFLVGIIFFMNQEVFAQFTETFEPQTPDIQDFTRNGQAFTLTEKFNIFSSRSGIGYGGSRRFIDNVNAPGLNQLNSIKTSGAELFTVKISGSSPLLMVAIPLSQRLLDHNWKNQWTNCIYLYKNPGIQQFIWFQ